MTHLPDALLADFLRSLSIPDAGTLLHLLTCPECAAKAQSSLGGPLERETPAAGKTSPAAERGLPIGADLHDRATFCLALAGQREAEGRHEEALALYERAASLFEDLGDVDQQAMAWIAEGELYLRLGEHAKALECFDSAGLLAAEGLEPTLALRAERGSARAVERSFPAGTAGGED